MEHLPIYIAAVFVLTTLLALYLIYKASRYSKTVIIVAIAWLTLQAALSLSGFYKVTMGVPPRFALLLVPPVVFIILRFALKSGRNFIDGLDIKTLNLLHLLRIPVEVTLYWLFLHKAVPVEMTFEGHNFDILSGLTALFIYYFGYLKKVLSKSVMLAWNILCLLLLINIVATAVLSAPFAFQQIGFGQPNIALLYFPFVWLPGFVVPAVLFTHLASIRQVLKAK